MGRYCGAMGSYPGLRSFYEGGPPSGLNEASHGTATLSVKGKFGWHYRLKSGDFICCG